jgi:hypothetical protein
MVRPEAQAPCARTHAPPAQRVGDEALVSHRHLVDDHTQRGDLCACPCTHAHMHTCTQRQHSAQQTAHCEALVTPALFLRQPLTPARPHTFTSCSSTRFMMHLRSISFTVCSLAWRWCAFGVLSFEYGFGCARTHARAPRVEYKQGARAGTRDSTAKAVHLACDDGGCAQGARHLCIQLAAAQAGALHNDLCAARCACCAVWWVHVVRALCACACVRAASDRRAALCA